MALKSSFTLFLTFMLSLNVASANNRSRLPTLATKQTANNIRFISNNGQFTYYQIRSGALLLGTNYKVTEVIKGQEGTQYYVYASRAKKKMLVTQDNYFHSYLGMRHLKGIYVMDYGTTNVQKLDSDGVSPSLHQNDSWASFYNSYLKTIDFVNLNMTALSFKIQIGSGKNPYFIPQVIMTDDNTILYTDLNSQGVPGIVKFTINDKKAVPLYKADAANSKIEMCENDQYFFIAEYGIESSKAGTQISIFQKKSFDITKKEVIYSSKSNDLGSLICDATQGQIYFIKNLTETDGKFVSEVAGISLASKEVKIMSDLGTVTSLINMDGNLLIPFRGKFHVLLGENNMANIDQLRTNTQVTEEGIEVAE
jgi:hypothetical protein